MKRRGRKKKLYFPFKLSLHFFPPFPRNRVTIGEEKRVFASFDELKRDRSDFRDFNDVLFKISVSPIYIYRSGARKLPIRGQSLQSAYIFKKSARTFAHLYTQREIPEQRGFAKKELTFSKQKNIPATAAVAARNTHITRVSHATQQSHFHIFYRVYLAARASLEDRQIPRLLLQLLLYIHTRKEKVCIYAYGISD